MIDELLALWRQAPNKELADAIVEVGAHLAIAARWDELEGRPSSSEIPRLLDAVLEKGSGKARERLEAVASWPLDPRIDRWVAAQYADPPLTSTSARPFWTRLLALAQRVTDTTAANQILKAHEGWKAEIPWHAFLAGHVDRAKVKLTAAFDIPFAATTRAAIDGARRTMREQIAAAKPERHADVQTLLAAVFANPADDGPRIVLGDVLQEQGDPRGELLALQLGPGNPKREREIVKQHAADLLGPLHAVLKSYTFSRGFLARATLKGGSARSVASAIMKVIGDPMWSTVEHLEEAPRELAMDPSMTSLRSLAHCKVPLELLAQHPTLVSLATKYEDDAWSRLADGVGFPALKELSVYLHARQAVLLVASPLATRLAKLDLRVGVESYVPQAMEQAFSLLHRLHELDPPEATLRFVRYRNGDWHSAYRFTPGAVEISVTKSNNVHEPLIQGDVTRPRSCRTSGGP